MGKKMTSTQAYLEDNEKYVNNNILDINKTFIPKFEID